MEAIPCRHDDPGHPPAGGAHGPAGGALSSDIQIHSERLDSPVGSELLAELDEDLHCRYGGGDPVLAPPEDFVAPGGRFLVVTLDATPVACGGFRRLDDDTAELKRMYVRPQARARGLARLLLHKLEEEAVSAGYRQLWLETGLSQPEAMRLYESSGYRPITSFGQYAGARDQRCFGKVLVSSDSNRAPLS